MWIDQNDTLNTLTSLLPKDPGNLVHGIQSYGFSEALLYCEAEIYTLWLLIANDCGMGLGLGLVASSLITRCIFLPSIVYGVSNFSFLSLKFFPMMKTYLSQRQLCIVASTCSVIIEGLTLGHNLYITANLCSLQHVLSKFWTVTLETNFVFSSFYSK